MPAVYFVRTYFPVVPSALLTLFSLLCVFVCACSCVRITGTGAGNGAAGATPILGPLYAVVDNECPECHYGDIDLGLSKSTPLLPYAQLHRDC
jgi:hypothetical protein